MRFKEINQTRIDMMLVMISAYSKSTDWKCESFRTLRSYYNFLCECECIRVCVCRIYFVYSLCSIKDSMRSLSLSSAIFCSWLVSHINKAYVCGLLKGCLCHVHHYDFARSCVFKQFSKIDWNFGLKSLKFFVKSLSDTGLCARQFWFVPNCCTCLDSNVRRENVVYNVHRLINIHASYVARQLRQTT